MVVGGVLLRGGAVGIVAGPQIARGLGMGEFAHWLAWPIVFLLLVGLLWTICYVLPAQDQSRVRRELLMGALAGTALWLAGTVLFRLYVSNLANFSRTGFVGGIIVLLLWLYNHRAVDSVRRRGGRLPVRRG